MKKLLGLGLLAITGVCSLAANDYSRSYFSVRPYYQHITPQNILVGQTQGDRHILKRSGFEVTAFGGVSTKSDDLARYFLFGGKTELIAREADPANVFSAELAQDILVGNFNVAVGAGFHSILSIEPQQTFGGAAFSYKRHFKENYWASLEIPVLHVNNDLNFRENVKTQTAVVAVAPALDSAPTVGNMKDAFKQLGMKYGRIDGAQTKNGVGDITLKIGYDSPKFNREDLFMSSYIGLVLPTSNKAKAVYMFEPLLGNGGHFAFMFGSRGEAKIRNYRDGSLWISWGIESQHLFENTQKRSFDLTRNGPWSRYLEMYPSEAKRVSGALIDRSFGINLLTLDAKVTPGYLGTITTALSYVGKQCYGTLGYTVHARQEETVKLKNAWQEGPMIAAYADAQAINPFRTIGTELDTLDSDNGATIGAVGDAAASVIKEVDLNLASAAHPGTISRMIYATIGSSYTYKKPCIFEAGASYEFGKENTTLNRFGVWGKIQISL